jgi:predicted ATPase
MKKYVITGGPGIGKTTVIEILASCGHKVVPEAARMIIEEEKIKGSEALPWLNLLRFQELVAERQLSLEKEHESEVTFHDRGIIDGHGYSILGRVKTPEIVERFGKNRYEKVFILEPLPFYENDTSRWEDKDEGLKIHLAIIDAYNHFGYKPIFVPVLPPEERVDFILKYL